MTKESFHAKIVEEENKLNSLEGDLRIAASMIKTYGADTEGLATYNKQVADLKQQRWVLSILKEADSLYVNPVPSQKPPVTPETTFD